MRYSVEDQLREVMQRKDLRRNRSNKQITGGLSAAAACLAVTIAAFLSFFSGSETTSVSDSAYGAFLLSSKSGSYVLCGVIAFVCGALITLLCIRRKQKQDAEKAKEIERRQTL